METDPMALKGIYYTIVKDRMPNEPYLWDDAIQEAAIAVWQYQVKHPDDKHYNPVQFYSKIARTRIWNFARSQDYTGTIQETCGKYMKRAQAKCVKRDGHAGKCGSTAKSNKSGRHHRASGEQMLRQTVSYDVMFTGWAQREGE